MGLAVFAAALGLVIGTVVFYAKKPIGTNGCTRGLPERKPDDFPVLPERSNAPTGNMYGGRMRSRSKRPR